MSLLFLLTLAHPWLDLLAPLNTAEVGDHGLQVLTPHLLELSLTNTQEVTLAEGVVSSPTVWDFLEHGARKANAPTKASFAVHANDGRLGVLGVGFTRRSVYAPEDKTDLRVRNAIYLLVDERIEDGMTVTVTDLPGDAEDYLKGLTFTTTVDPDRLNSAIHLNHVGFVPQYRDGLLGVKQGYASLFLGDLGVARVDEVTREWVVDVIDDPAQGTFTGERYPLGVNLNDGFEIVATDTGEVIYPVGAETAIWNVRGDSRWPAYDGVLEADFSAVIAPGHYRLRVPGMGASFPFRIGNEVAATFARTFALGLYHQRSGEDHKAPYTRYLDGPAHLEPATLPVDDGQDALTYAFVAENSNAFFNPEDRVHPAMQALSPETLLYPFVGDMAAWWPMDGRQVVMESDLVEGFDSYADTVITDPYGGDPNGHAFGEEPSRRATPGIGATATSPAVVGQESWIADGVAFDGLNGFRGVGFVNSYHLPDGWQSSPSVQETRATGRLLTKSFTIDQAFVGFLIGGSARPYDLTGTPSQQDVTAVNLLIGGRRVATATGANSNTMSWHHWDVSAYQGQQASVEIIDSSTTGFILVDELMQTARDRVRDLSAARAHPQFVGGGSQVPGVLGSAWAFDGIDDHVVAGAVPALDGATAATLSFWMRVQDRSRDQTLLAKGDASGGYSLSYRAPSQSLHLTAGGQVVDGTSIPISDSDWHFVVIRFQAGVARGLELLVDHKMAAAASTTAMKAFPNTQAPLYVGNGSSLHAATFFRGDLDDVRIRSSAVSDEELLETSAGAGPWVDVSGGHFDAGDYSKYMKNSGLMVHILSFTVDQILKIDGEGAGADPFDNLGLPESGDGICDLLQESKWEADYIAKMQDTDGGFFAMVNPRGRRFENDVLPSEGDRQVVWPKSLIATGVAVGALAELANSPAFKRHYPAEAASFRAKAFLGWQFIERAVATHGVAGGHQQIYHYGATFQARDELAHAAAAMFAMTGDPAYEARLIEWMPYDPAIENHDLVKGWRPFRRFTWQRLYESAGAAMRLYAFANRGALSGNPVAYAADLVLGKTYLEHVIDEIKGAGEDTLERAEQSPYGVSVPIESKAFGGVSYIFAESEAFDLITASLLDPKPAYWKAVLSNVAYQAGGNPVNTSFISGLGWVQPRNFVSQWALNDEHQLPPIGLTTGSVNSALPFLLRYGSALGRLSYPPDVHESDYAFPFGTYHRYTDTFHVGNELVILDLARSMATTSFLMAQVPDAATAPWVAPPAVAIKGIPEESYVGEAVRLGIETTGDLTEARVLWEAKNGTIGLGGEYAYTPVAPAEQWIEAEVLWPSGLRSFARSTFQVREPVDLEYIENFQPAVAYFADGPYRKILGNDHVRVYYPLDGDVRAVKGPLVDRGVLFPALALFGDAEVELGYFTFPGYEHTRPSYANVGFHGGADRMQVEFTAPNALFPSGADWISVEAMLYVESFDEGVVDAELIRFESSREPRLHVTRSRWEGPTAFWTGYDDEVDITEAVPERAWIHLRLVQDTTTAYAFVDGKLVHSEPVSTLESWLAPRETFTLSIGQYYGWASNVIIKAGNGPLEIADSEREIVLGAPVVDLGSFVDIDVLDSYVPQAQVYSESNSSELIYHWSGSPGVVISDPAVLKPAVTFPGLGDHWLELEVRDSSGKRGRDEVRIRVINLSGNTAPTVDLGAPVSIRLPDAWVPSPVIADDGNPVGALSYFWMQLSGPSPAAISDPAVEAPSIHFTTEGVYVFEMTVSDSFLTEFDRIAVIVDDRRGPPRPGNSYVADADTIALYHFDGDLTDASGRGNDLMSEGATTAFASDTRWMASPAGASASFSDVGDQLSVTLPDSLIMPDLVPPDTTTELTLEWRYFARNDVAYSRESVTIVGLLQDYDALLDLSQDRWTVPTNGSVNFGQATVRAAFLEYYLPKGQWLEMKMTYRDDSADDDEGQGRLFINGQMVAERPVTFNHGRDSEWKLVLGNIDGLVDELRVSRVVRLDLPVNEPPLVAVDPWAHLTEPSAVTVQPPLVMDDGVSGDVLTYVWEVVGGSADNVRIADATLATPQVTFLAAGSYTLRVTVSDGEFTASGLSEWLVAFESPPILEPIGPKEIAEGGRLTFTASAHDKDVGDILTYSLEGVVPVGASMSPSGEFSWIPTDAQGPGVFTFDVVVTDNSSRLLSDRETITVRVAGSPFDAWIAEFFPGVSDPAIVGMAADPNADGWSNGLAFVLAMDPKAHQADRLPRQMADAVYSITEHGWSDRARALQPVVRFSTDMISWKEAIHGEDGVVIETLDDGFGRAADGSGIDRVTVKIPHRGGAIFTKLVLPMQP